MEFISIKDFDENHWQKYFDLSQEILRRHYPQFYNPQRVLENFKTRTQNNASSDSTYQLFLLIDKDSAVAWFDTSVWNNELYFGFDVADSEIDLHLLSSMLIKLSEQMKNDENPYALTFSYREAICSSLISINAPVNEELIISRLEKAEMNRTFYNNILNDNKLNSWKIEHLSEVPDNYIESFVNCINVCFDDMRALSPVNSVMPPLTPEEWKKDKSLQRSNGTTLDILILLDEHVVVAGILWMCNDSSRKDTLRHNGGLTAVLPKYRGLGIAKYLKAKMYKKLLDENKDFKFITTDTMLWNTYMYRINEEFGFKLHKKGYAFKLTSEFIENFIKSNKN